MILSNIICVLGIILYLGFIEFVFYIFYEIFLNSEHPILVLSLLFLNFQIN